jgi:hypothetical protein
MRRSLGGICGVEEGTSGVVVDGVGNSIWARGRGVLYFREEVSSLGSDPALNKNLVVDLDSERFDFAH